MKKNLVLALALGVLLVAVLAGCGGSNAASNNPPSAAPAATAVANNAPAAKPTAAAPAANAAKPAPTKSPDAKTLTITLKKGIKWSDGTELTSKDLVGTYNILWAQGDPYGMWSALYDVKSVDNYTADFVINTPGVRIQNLILRSIQPVAYSEYGKWMDKAATMRQNNASDAERKKFNDDLLAAKPDKSVSYGPFVIDSSSITEAQLTEVKNPGGYNADKIGFDKITVYYGEANETVPLVLSGDIDYASHSFTPANIKAFQESGNNIQIIRGPLGIGPGLWFNEDVYPLGKKEVRQAFAYIIDRAENAQVAMGDSGKPIKYMAGFTDLQVPKWLDQDTISKLNPYNQDTSKAEALLTGIGFKKGSDGNWVDDQGKPLAFEISVPSDYADWFASAENAAQQLQKFGIQATVRGFQSSQLRTNEKEGQYQILVDTSLLYNPPHPYRSFDYYLSAPKDNPEATSGSKGYDFPWKQTLDGQQVDVQDLIAGARNGLDPEQQKPYIAKLSRIVNEQLPVLALWERYSDDPINTSVRVSGWLPLTDKVYQNAQYDNYVSIQLLAGTLKPSDATDKEFKTSYPYPQPPKGDLNYFTDNSIPNSFTGPAYDAEFPPLFFYMWADGKYVPEVAEKYEIK